jgi:hypothetical protein
MSILPEASDPQLNEGNLKSSEKPFLPPRLFERDIDLLLAEEFKVSARFASEFLRKLNFEDVPTGSVVGVHVSKIDTSGESDLVVIFEKPGSEERFAIFIEDKIDAPFQPEQLARYRQRAETGKGYKDYKIVLLAPEAYLTADFGFDAKISYESVATILTTVEPGERSFYRAEAIFQAAKNARKPSATKEFDTETTAFWSAAYKIALTEFSELEMRSIGQPAKGLNWVQFRTVAMTRKPVFVSLLLKGDKGVAELSFSGIDYEKFHSQISSLLENGMTVAKYGESSLVIKAQTPKFVITPFGDDAGSTIRKAFEVCVRLVRFYDQHKAELDHAALQSLVSPKPLTY